MSENKKRVEIRIKDGKTSEFEMNLKDAIFDKLSKDYPNYRVKAITLGEKMYVEIEKKK